MASLTEQGAEPVHNTDGVERIECNNGQFIHVPIIGGKEEGTLTIRSNDIVFNNGKVDRYCDLKNIIIKDKNLFVKDVSSVMYTLYI